jgi:uncharacterized Zn-finger protein
MLMTTNSSQDSSNFSQPQQYYLPNESSASSSDVNSSADAHHLPMMNYAYIQVPYPFHYSPQHFIPFPYPYAYPPTTMGFHYQPNFIPQVVGFDQNSSAIPVPCAGIVIPPASPVIYEEKKSLDPTEADGSSPFSGESRFKDRDGNSEEDDGSSAVGSLKCDVCQKTFMHKKHLRRHKIIHSDLREYVCQDCGKSFRRKDNLQSHRRLHTGEMPYECTICNKRFRHQSGLSNHAKSCN